MYPESAHRCQSFRGGCLVNYFCFGLVISKVAHYQSAWIPLDSCPPPALQSWSDENHWSWGNNTDANPALTDKYPVFANKPIGATATMFIEMKGVDALHDRLRPSVKIVMPLVTQFYGLREFAIEDPDGYVITFAERVNG